MRHLGYGNKGYLTFGTEKFNWETGNPIIIHPRNRKKNILLVLYSENSMLKFINNKLKNQTNTAIEYIPAEFISKAIKFAIQNNWNTKDAVNEIEIEYSNGAFSLVK